jgi:hypothetical protein
MFSAEYYSSFHNIEQIIKHFFARFKVERAMFQQHFTQQDPPLTLNEQEQLISLFINRLILLYFLQKRGLLNGNIHYLTHQLQTTQCRSGEDMFYHSFLVILFHQGLGTIKRSPDILALLGEIPYLGGSLFTQREIEYQHPMLKLPDTAFERIFTFFDLYRWQLDEPPIKEEGVLTPNVLGYIFEQYVNQQQMGAYYTMEDVTMYIANNTIIPCLFDILAQKNPEVFAPESPIWYPLQTMPERYISETMASHTYLPDETPYEYAQRCHTYIQVRELLSTGQIKTIDDFISYNLYLNRFAIDFIQSLVDPALLLTCYQQLIAMTILDPTCGSGAFLLAALRTLLPLYEACLDQFQKLAYHPTCQSILMDMATPKSLRRYKIVKTIVTRNLYGIDLMEEATEICKLHLFLTLVAQVESTQDIEPLPNIDHNIHTGNVLMEMDTMEETTHSSIITADTFQPDPAPLSSWQQGFKEILQQGGFSIIIGNPPYVEFSGQTFPYTLNHFTTNVCANLYTCVVERSHQLLSAQGRHGMILPLAAFATRNMQPFLEAFRLWFPVSWLSFYHFRPSMLFSGGRVANIPTAIYITKTKGPEKRFSTHLIKWSHEQRSTLFPRLIYHHITASTDPVNRHYYPKLSQNCEDIILNRLLTHPTVSTYISRTPSRNTMYYRTAGGLYWKVFVNFPWPYHTTSNKQCFFQEIYHRDIFVALFNSSLFWWYYTVTFDTFNLKDYMLFGFRFTYPDNLAVIEELQMHSQRLMEDFCQHAKHLKRGQTGSYTIYARKSKSIIDAIDRLLAQHYGLSATELEFILNYDIKYRLGLTPDEFSTK